MKLGFIGAGNMAGAILLGGAHGANVYDVNAETNYVANKFTTSNTATMAEKMAYLYKLEEECFTNVIMGNESIEAFDKFVSDWYANGGEQITKEVNDWYATTK